MTAALIFPFSAKLACRRNRIRIPCVTISIKTYIISPWYFEFVPKKWSNIFNLAGIKNWHEDAIHVFILILTREKQIRFYLQVFPAGKGLSGKFVAV